MRHPDVAQAAAYAVPHPRLGEDVAAAVVLRPGSKITPEELREFLGKQLATYKNPRRITIVDQLPKGITGKVQRKRLSESSEGQSEAASVGGPPARGFAAVVEEVLEDGQRLHR